MLEKYEIIKPLHRSHSSQVFLGKEKASDLLVAIKIIENQDANYRSYFYKEIEISKKLSNAPHFVRFIDAFEEAGNFYFITQYLENAQSIKSYQKYPEKIIQFAIQATQALAHLHKEKILHCDINPNNILIFNDNLFFLDFGISKYKTNHASSHTGTLPYMSPEQLGYLKQYPLGNYSDLYSLGITLYETLSGALPFFDNDKNKLIQKILTENPKPLHTLFPNIPLMLSDIINKMIQKDPLERYQTAEGLLYDLEILANNPLYTDYRLGERDYSGTLCFTFKPIGIENYMLMVERFLARGKNILFCGSFFSGKTTLLKYVADYYKDRHFIFIDCSDRQTDIFKTILENSLSLLSKEKIINSLDGNLLSPLSYFFPDLFEKQEENAETYDKEKIFLIIFNKIFELLKENNIWLILDNMHLLDSMSLKIIKKCEKSNMIASIDLEHKTTDSFYSERFGIIDIMPLSSKDLKNFLSEIFNHQMSEKDLAFLTSKFLHLSFYAGEIIENIKLLYTQHYVSYRPDKNQWVIDQETIQKLNFESFYQEYMKQKVRELSDKELLILQIASLLIPPFDLDFLIEIFASLTKIPLEEVFDFLIDKILAFKKTGFLKTAENSLLELNSTVKEIIFSTLSLEKQNHIKNTIIDALLHYPETDQNLELIVDYMKQVNHPQLKHYLVKSFENKLKNKKIVESLPDYIEIFKHIDNDEEYLSYIEKFIFFKNFMKDYPLFAPMMNKAENILQEKSFKTSQKISAMLSLVLFYFTSNNFTKAKEWIAKLLPLSLEFSHHLATYYCYSFLGAISFFTAKFQDAEKYLTQAIHILEINNITERKAYNYSLLSLSLSLLGKKEEAIKNGIKGVQFALDCANMGDMAICFHFVGYAFSRFGLTEKGIEFSQEALMIAKKINSPLLEYSAFFSLGLGYLMEDIFTEAENYLLTSLEIGKKNNFMLGLDWIYQIILELYFRKKDKENFEKKLEELKKLENFFQNYENYHMTLLKNQGIYFLFHNDFISAENILQKALSLAREICDPIEEMRILCLLYYVTQELGDLSSSMLYYKSAETIYKKYEIEKDRKYYFTKNIFGVSDFSYTMTSTFASRSLKENIAYESILRSTAILSSILEPDKIILKLLHILFETFGVEKGAIILDWENFKQALYLDNNLNPISPIAEIEIFRERIKKEKTPLLFSNASKEMENKITDKSLLIYPILHRGSYIGMIYLAHSSLTGLFSTNDIPVISALANQTAIALENALNFLKEKEARRKAEATLKAFQLFVPPQFLDVIASEGIETIRLGNAMQKKVSILFTDIRDFTSISESMTPEELMIFLNSYMDVIIGENIEKHNGFIDKFIGDAVMAIFDQEYTDNALKASICIQSALLKYNSIMAMEKRKPIHIGIGLNFGEVILGTVGTKNRMDSTVIGNEVNLASRLEGLSKIYNTPIIVSASIIKNLRHPEDFDYREIDSVTVKGKSIPVTIYEVFSWEEEKIRELKKSYEADLLMGITFYKIREFNSALELFEKCYQKNPSDGVIRLYINRCKNYLAKPPEEDWDGTIKLDEK